MGLGRHALKGKSRWDLKACLKGKKNYLVKSVGKRETVTAAATHDG